MVRIMRRCRWLVQLKANKGQPHIVIIYFLYFNFATNCYPSISPGVSVVTQTGAYFLSFSEGLKGMISALPLYRVSLGFRAFVKEREPVFQIGIFFLQHSDFLPKQFNFVLL